MRAFQKKTGILLLLALAACCAILLLVFKSGHEETAEGRGWTVMVYMVNSSDLERRGQVTKDLEEMRGAIRDDTTLLVMAGGAEPWTNELLSEGSGIYRVTKNEITSLNRWTGSMVGEEALTQLLKTGMEQAEGPAALILWDHGYGALDGFGKDEHWAGDRLTLTELGQSLKLGLNGKKLALLGFDACMMACVESAIAAAPYAEYMVSSQDTEAEDGWDYSFLSMLGPDFRAEEAGRAIVQSFEAYYSDQYAKAPQCWQPYTLSLVKLEGMEALSNAVNSFLGNLRGFADPDGEWFSSISRIRSSACAFGRVTTTTEYDLIDLGSLVTHYRAKSPDAQQVLDALNACVVCRGGDTENACGLSLYFPQLGRKSDRAKRLAQMNELPLGQDWKDFLASFETKLDSDRAPMLLTKEEQGYAVTLDDALLQDFDRAKYFVLEEIEDGSMRLLYMGTDCLLQDHTVSAPYHNQCLMLHTPGADCLLPAFYIQEDGQSAYYQSAILTLKEDSAGPRAARMRVKYDKQKDAWQVLSAFDISDSLVTGRQEIRLEEQDEIWVVSSFYRPELLTDRYPAPYTQWKTTANMDVEFLNFGGEYSMWEGTLQKKEGCRYWLQLVVVDVYQSEYSSPLFPLEELPVV